MAVTLTVGGAADFESIPNNPGSGALDYSKSAYKPIRGATVELVNTSGATLATSATTDSGTYTLGPVAVYGDVFVRVRSAIQRSAPTGGTYDFSVRDNTQSDALYVLDTPRFTPRAATPVVTRNLRASSGWNGARYANVRAAAPFAILNVAYQATQKVLGHSPDQVFPPLQLYWSANNRPASGYPSAGHIGTSYYTDDGASHKIYLLGSEDDDTDEYDSHVIAHEWGHYYQSAFSRDDSVGGAHSTGDRLDMTVAFSEGWGNAWSAMVLNDPRYADSSKAQQGTGFIIDVSQLPAVDDRGWYSESSLQYAFWNLHQQIGFNAIANVMTGSLKASTLLAAPHNFADLLLAATRGDKVRSGAVRGAFYELAIQVGSDGTGTDENNDGGVPLALPIYKTYTDGRQNFCTTSSANKAYNGLGLRIPIRFSIAELSGGGRHTMTIGVTAQSPTSGTNPDFAVVKTSAQHPVILATSFTPNQESYTGKPLPPGDYLMLVYDREQTEGNATGTRCFDLSIHTYTISY